MHRLGAELVKALDRKLLRDLRLMWSQALTIALVVASGVGGFVCSLSAVDSLARARDDYYAQAHFADIFVDLKRAPDALEAMLLKTAGVADLQTTVEQVVRATIPGVSDPIVGRLIGVDEARHPARLNQLTVRNGRALDPADRGRPDGSLEALVSEGFAEARGLKPGARVEVLVNGKLRWLEIVGIALSPEYVFAGLWGMPDQRGFAVFWVNRDALAAAYDMHGAFNHLAVRLAPGASERGTREALEGMLARYGGREAIGRADQASNAMLTNEIDGQHVIGTVLPAIFLAVAAFLLNVVVSRIVATQREQIAALKALGYENMAIALHYLKFVLVIVSIGFLMGLVLGDRLGEMFTGLYADLFHFPRLEHRVAPWLVAVSAGVTLVTAIFGTVNAIVATARLSPAEAMRPPAPDHYRRTLVDRLGIRAFGPATRMILRNVERRPWRTGLSITGVAAAVAIVILGYFFRDAIEVVIDTQFSLSMRSDLAVWMVEPVDDGARHAMARLPAVTAVESTRFMPVTFVHGARRERSLIRGYDGHAELYRVIDAGRQAVPLEGRGLIMNDRLAAKLDLHPGDPVQVEVLEGRPRTLTVSLGGTVDELMGLNAYMDRRELNRLLQEGDLTGGYMLALERGRESAALEATRGLPRVAGAFSKATMLRNMEEISARNVRITSTILTIFAAIIAVGVVYNNARIALAERGWELASLRVLGFTRAEVSGLLLGELALVIAIALPLGMALGWELTHVIARLLQTDQFHFPAVARARTYAWAAVCVLVAGVASALVVRRRIDRLDLVAVLKTRD
jgi:putative ABC transport system permease protein